MNPKVWVCQVRREAFVGGESQRCRHATGSLGECGVMELIGGEPIDYCRMHGAELSSFDGTKKYCMVADAVDESDPCQFESQIRVGP